MEPEAAPETSSIDKLAKTFEPLSKALGLLLIAAYATGYLTVSLYYSSLGMGLTNVLKPEILSAGFIFLLFTVSPMWGSYYSFKLEELRDTAESSSYYTTILKGASQLFTFSVLLAIPASAIFVLSSFNPPKWNTAVYCLVYALDAAVWTTLSVSRKVQELTRRAPWTLWAVSAAILLSWFFLSINPGNGFTRRRLSLWFFACGFFPMLALTPNLRKDSSRLHWPYQAFQILCFLAIFPTRVFPYIASQWGGGQPVSALLTLSKDSVVLPQRSIRVGIIAQDDAGIYVLADGGHKAVFVPRSSVGAIVFSKDSRDLLK
ncbi:hypothetical protein RBB77_21700 [Tunturibacter psychrotolerans]|uniref:Uncharacterized protein n=1 Tax=Tunturiibacter psychrotolerans TaxID=3069686 RepID=A0AAU7ZPZ2_9BACT